MLDLGHLPGLSRGVGRRERAGQEMMTGLISIWLAG